MGYSIGIDLGTTNSVVSVVRRGVVESLPVDGASTLPSVVSVRADGSVLVGRAAKSRLQLDAESTIASAKRFMGDRSKVYRVGGRTMTPVDVASVVLRRLSEAARDALGEQPLDAVITIPAYFNEVQRKDTRQAGEDAGLRVLQLLPEPTAAAIAYGVDKGKDQRLVVYDLGGGTFDVSILEVSGNEFHVKAVGGDGQLGGDDFDAAIVEWAEGEFKRQHGIDVRTLKGREAAVARQKLREAAEAAKISLSEPGSNTAALRIPDFARGVALELELTLMVYNRLVERLVERTLEVTRKVLSDARLSADDIDRLILVGGSSRNKAVKQAVTAAIKEPFTVERVDEVVSHGAARVAADLQLPVPKLQLSEVTGHSLGVDVMEDRKQLIFQPIIPRQTAYPCRFGYVGWTGGMMQAQVRISAFRGEDRDPQKNTWLGKLEFPVTPSLSRLVIGVIFELDRDGILHFTAVEMPEGPRSHAIDEHAKACDGAMLMDAVDELIRTGGAKTHSVVIQT